MANRDIDDVYKRINSKNSYKNRRFSDKKSIIDDYTGERIFYGNDNDACYTHPLNKTADIDHITPIAKVRERYSNLTIEQQKTLANNEKYNYAVTNSELNRNSRTGKNALENHEYLNKKFDEVVSTVKSGDLEETIQETKKLTRKSGRMLAAEVKSRSGMAIEATGMRVNNKVKKIIPLTKEAVIGVRSNITSIGNDFILGATRSVQGSSIILMTNGVRNLCLVATGEKEFNEAVKDTGKLGVQVAITGGSKEVALSAVQGILKENTNKALEKVLNSNTTAQIITISFLVKESLIKYINSEITGEQFIQEIGMQGVQMLSGTIGAIAGQALIPIPVVGAFIGSVVISTVCVEICKSVIHLRDTYKSVNSYNKKISQINKISSEAIMEIEKQQVVLKDMIKAQFLEWDNEFNSGIDEIFTATMNNNVEGIADGLDRILGVFKENVKFKTYEEFNNFFMDENNILTL